MEKQINVDLLVIGGGVNGTGIARDAAGRGLAVMLCEQGDLAGATSSASSKLIHGGLRYLEYYRFRFVREALMEREVLLGIAPHIVWPARFILPHDKGLRPCFGDRGRPLSLRLARAAQPLGPLAPPRSPHGQGGRPAQGPSDDRLCLFGLPRGRCQTGCAERRRRARTRRRLSAPRTRCVSAKREQGKWQATLLDMREAATTIVTARALVNAAGPWAAEVLSGVIGRDRRQRTPSRQG